MQLDINHEWVQFNTYSNENGTIHGSRILKDMRGPDDRWLSQDTRDFFAVFARPSGPGSPRSTPRTRRPGPPSGPCDGRGAPGSRHWGADNVLEGRVILAFGDCELDLDRYELRRGGLLVPIEPQVFDVLVHLASHPDRVVSKEELLDTVWGDRFVSESALTSRIKAARRAVGDDGTRQAVIATVHGRGYRMVVPVHEHGGNGRGQVRAPPPLNDVHPLALLERDEPLAELTRALAAARSGSGRLVCVAGEAGIGKSALIRSFADQAADHAPVMVTGCDDLRRRGRSARSATSSTGCRTTAGTTSPTTSAGPTCHGSSRPSARSAVASS